MLIFSFFCLLAGNGVMLGMWRQCRDTCSQGVFIRRFRALGAPVVFEANQRSSRALGGLEAGYVRVIVPVEDVE